MQAHFDTNDDDAIEAHEANSRRSSSMSRREPVNILILGASYAGLSVAHQFLRQTIHRLGTTRTSPKYRVQLVSPSTHFYWNVGAPRAICSSKLVPERDAFLPIAQGFQAYPPEYFRFIHGKAVSVNFPRRTVDIQLLGTDGSDTQNIQTISYHALVIATGCSADSDLLSLHGDHGQTEHAIHQFQHDLLTASSVVIVGGGPSGIECAGQLATWVNREQNRRVDPTPHNDSKGKSVLITPKQAFISPTFDDVVAKSDEPSSQTPLKITLISGYNRLLPRLSPEVGLRAEKQLKSQGINIMHNVRLIAAQRQRRGSVHCILSNDMTLVTDLFIEATGVQPNTSFLPDEFLDASKYVASDPHFCRVSRAGDRVYAIGSVTAGSKSVSDVYRALPVLMQNLYNDLMAYEIKTHYPYGGAEEAIKKLKDLRMTDSSFKDVTVLCPITRWGGSGVVKGHPVPTMAVWALKGKDYGFKSAKKVVFHGTNPFPG